MLRIMARPSSDGAHDAAQVAFHERHAGALHRDVRAGAHRDAHVGGGQCGRVVDAVAGHADDLRPAALSAFTFSCLSCGVTPAWKSAMPSWRATASAVRGLSPVSMKTLTPSSRKFGERLGRGGLHGVGHDQDAGRAAVDGHEDGGRAFGLVWGGERFPARRCRPTPLSRRKSGLPTNTRRPATVPATPPAVVD